MISNVMTVYLKNKGQNSMILSDQLAVTQIGDPTFQNAKWTFGGSKDPILRFNQINNSLLDLNLPDLLEYLKLKYLNDDQHLL